MRPARLRKKDPDLFINRELSWLAFNFRVLEEAMDPTVPLLDRLRFAIIVSTNLDEFFMVRVAGLKNAVQEGDSTADLAGLTPRQQLHVVAERAHEMVQALGQTLTDQILPALADEGVRIVALASLEPPQRGYLSRYFRSEVLPALTPLAIDASRPFPRLANLTLNLAVLLAPAEGEDHPRLGVVQVPSGLRRLVRPIGVDGAGHVLIEEIIRSELATLFPGQAILESSLFRIVRDAEMELDDEGGRDYLQAVEEELRKRRSNRVVRLEVEAAVGDTLLGILVQRLDIEVPDIYHVRGPLDVRALQTLVDLPALERLREPPLKPVPTLDPAAQQEIFDVVRQHDVLLHHPYESFDPVVAFVTAAARDPDVLAIKQTLYRTSGDSPIVQALAAAAENGKQVTVLVELMARFDELSNIRWARSLEESGAHVIYGIRGYKTHAKICLVVRRGRHGIERFVHLGTGNYNEKTARLYTDFGLMTADQAIGEDASAFFNALTGYSDPPRMRKLVMAPSTLRERLLRLIEREQRRAEEGQAAEIRAKMNSLVDEDLIRALYDASRAGVKIRLNVRGICCLRPGVKGVSETIEVVSIVDRFLEHSRVYYFRNGGDEEVYLSTADWMPRNLDRRIELLFPVSPECRKKVLEVLDFMFQDNVKARRLTADGTYRRKRPLRGEEPSRAQLRLYEQTRRSAERAQAAGTEAFEPLTRPAEKASAPS
ncbi:MAG TPA: polyphosphate kinase 1 [Vicinamibacteria bacterium]|nr:polyphosphate kinase 1 [Vicinamibacteria bacterium]